MASRNCARSRASTCGAGHVIPLEDLEVQIAVFPYSTDLLDPTTGELQCPTDVQYDATGFPVTADEPCDPESAVCPVVPAVGGLRVLPPR